MDKKWQRSRRHCSLFSWLCPRPVFSYPCFWQPFFQLRWFSCSLNKTGSSVAEPAHDKHQRMELERNQAFIRCDVKFILNSFTTYINSIPVRLKPPSLWVYWPDLIPHPSFWPVMDLLDEQIYSRFYTPLRVFLINWLTLDVSPWMLSICCATLLLLGLIYASTATS